MKLPHFKIQTEPNSSGLLAQSFSLEISIGKHCEG